MHDDATRVESHGIADSPSAQLPPHSVQTVRADIAPMGFEGSRVTPFTQSQQRHPVEPSLGLHTLPVSKSGSKKSMTVDGTYTL
jgi:hypothetical protein